MFNKLKEKGVKLVADELAKHGEVKQKINEVADALKDEAEKRDLTAKANKTIKFYNNIILALKILLGIGIILLIIGVINVSVVLIILGALFIVPNALILLKFAALKKQALVLLNPTNAAIDFLKKF